jgi:GSH-dependent disulfide-bond oxidoreductase
VCLVKAVAATRASRKARSKETAASAKATGRKAGNAARKKPKKPIDLYYWPTPNGFKVSIMLEECRLPYTLIPVNIARGDQFKPEFLAISPNNRMPAIVDHDGPGGRPISIFESGAILQYLGRKTGKFYPKEERGRVEVDQWLFWQMSNLGPKAGEANHFRNYASVKQDYAIERFGNEMHRLYGVMNRRLADRAFFAGRYSIADMACVGWVRLSVRQGQDMGDFPHVKRWLDALLARPAVERGIHLRVEEASKVDIKDPKVRAVLFGQRAR